MRQDRVRISQCMIVKDEEKNIRQALSWGREIAFEQIVVDTGSTDRTAAIARELGARVYHFDWIQDFAAAKNFAIEKAEGDWIAFLDADEYFTEEWAAKLPKLLADLQQTDCLAVSAPWVNIGDEGEILSVAKQWRVFRRIPKLCYHRPIHEILMYQDSLILKERVWDTGEEFPIYHTGYASSVNSVKNKDQRNRVILLAELQKKPNDHSIMGYLGDICMGEGRQDEAVMWFQKAIEAMPQRLDPADERSAATYLYLLNLYTQKKDEQAFWELYHSARERLPWVYDVDYLAARFLLEREQYAEALQHLQQAFAVIQQYEKSAYGLYLFANISAFWEDMALCYYETGNLPASVERCVSLLREDKYRIRALGILLMALAGEKPEAVLKFLRNLYILDDPKDRIFVIKAAVQAKAVAFLKVLKPLCSAEEVSVLEAAIGKIEQQGSK